MNSNLTKTLFFASAAVLGVSSLQAKEAKRPNILFIIVDDQDPGTLGVYGDTQCDTPVLDKFAKEGMTVMGAHQMGSFSIAVSVASRTMIMTGNSVWKAETLRGRKSGYNARENSLPALFNNAGYDTFRTCKRNNSYGPANALFTTRFESICRGASDDKGSKWHADHVINYFNARAESTQEKKPFMVYLGFTHPHDPRNGKPELLQKYGAENVAVPTKVNEKTPKLPVNWLPEKPFTDGDPTLRDEVAVQGVMKRRDEITVRNEKGKEFACIENIDIQIGRVLEALEKTGELDNTYIFFTSDHGIAVGKHAFMGKQNLYEHTFRVPFLIKGPGVAKNKLVEGNIYLADVLPTLCDIADIKVPESVDAKSFKSVIEGKQESIRDVLYGAYCGSSRPGMRCVKQGDWKLIKYDLDSGRVHETQLFNLKENPNELLLEHHAPEIVAKTGNSPKKNQVNLADDSKYKKKVAEMEALLLEQMIAYGDPYRLWDQPALSPEQQAVLDAREAAEKAAADKYAATLKARAAKRSKK